MNTIENVDKEALYKANARVEYAINRLLRAVVNSSSTAIILRRVGDLSDARIGV